MKRRRSRSRQKETAELNITAFMNLMVVLVPFLLLTAVFTHLSILDLNLPSLGDSPPNKKDKNEFNLEVIIRKDRMILSDTRGGVIKSIPTKQGKYNYIVLSDTLKQIKSRFPDKTNATILAEVDTEYDTLIQVMDYLRMYHATDEDGQPMQAELFPDISIGDAPK